ncbi:DnaJ domain-containing protein [Haloprofundus salinisoli]|uniref:DnaJ domain-containing protein n=1 Tax=Haloprofundus salinisoli TaxID=2876193 RepID=UPI001CCF7061|nr:DnaJ domain-containing protein [Haloprofundus salinisoli]
MVDTYYEQLGVSRDASYAEVKAKFRERLLERHPDVRGEADARQLTRELVHARGVLRDFREEYDKTLAELGPTYGHRTFEKWWDFGGGIYDVDAWIETHRPDNVDDPSTLFVDDPKPESAKSDDTGPDDSAETTYHGPKYETGSGEGRTDWSRYEGPTGGDEESEVSGTGDGAYWERWRDDFLDESSPGARGRAETAADRESVRSEAHSARSAARSGDAAAESVSQSTTRAVTAAGEFYDRLGVDPDTTQAEIRDRFEEIDAAYSSTDRATVEGEEQYQKYVKAFEILDNPRLRAWYDTLGHEEFSGGWASLRGWPSGVDMEAYTSERGYDADAVEADVETGSTYRVERTSSNGSLRRRLGFVLVVLVVLVLVWLFFIP